MAKQNWKFNLIVGVVMIAFFLLTGCASRLANKQMEEVAKDWCKVIRASQIIPVYPLTEDLQVGDVFLVQTTVDKQHEEYKKRGFLPMDNHLARIPAESFSAFYDDSFYSPSNTGEGSGSQKLTLPKEWLEKGWENAPGASFPSYSFSVSSGGGLNMAIPVQGVPIGLSLLGSGTGDGTITISKARTYGIDTESLLTAVRKWETEAYSFLLNYSSNEERSNYIRVISRVYLAKEINVSVRSADSKGVSIAAGAPKPVELMTVRAPEDDSEAKVTAATVKNYPEGLKAINTHIENALKSNPGDLAGLLPGGTVKLVAASSRSVSLKETFSRPMVVGYLAFDMRIGEHGILGPPIPTHAVLENKVRPPQFYSETVKMIGAGRLNLSYRLLTDLVKQGESRSAVLQKELDAIASYLPDTYEVPIFSVGPDKKLVQKFPETQACQSDPLKFSDVIIYYSRLMVSKKAILSAGDPDEQKRWLSATESSIGKVRYLLKKHDAVIQDLNNYTYSY